MIKKGRDDPIKYFITYSLFVINLIGFLMYNTGNFSIFNNEILFYVIMLVLPVVTQVLLGIILRLTTSKVFSLLIVSFFLINFLVLISQLLIILIGFQNYS